MELFLRFLFCMFCSLTIISPYVKVYAVETDEFLHDSFPKDFLWGFATAAYQIEGGWNAHGKGENIWDEFTHRVPSPIVDNSTGDDACKSYEKYWDDVELLKDIGADYYRFSVSWARVIPTGKYDDGVNEAGIAYYNNLIDLLIENKIIPMVTMYHWDLPQSLQSEYGGWPSEQLVPHFKAYAGLLYERFGDRVKHWITFNEPWVVCIEGYSTGVMAPGISVPSTEPYKCAHTIIKSHAEAYHLYKEQYASEQQGRVGITLDSGYYQAFDETNTTHVEAAETAQQFKHGWFGSPIFFGKYPDVMRQKIDREGEVSRLPSFTTEESERIKGTWDFLGLNHYTTQYAAPAEDQLESGWFGDQETRTWHDPEWPESSASWLKTVPWGFRKLLNWLKNTYDNPEVFVTENGFADDPDTGYDDAGRVHYYTNYINQMLKAIKLDGCHVTSYTAWSLMDNFEWARGYTERFGVHYVDFNNPERPRLAKKSAELLKRIFHDNGFPLEDHQFLYDTFPIGFKWGVATSAYQIEGAWDKDGKGESIWDDFTHRVPSVIHDATTGDDACKSYEKYTEDVDLMVLMAVKFYRFSISWSRIIPSGKLSDGINEAGINHYSDLIDLLISKRITPVVTMYHWDLPQGLMEGGGWPNEELIEHFKDYANLLYSRYGDRVKDWITFNEPWVVCIEGYATASMAPGRYENADTDPYECAHTIIKSHAEAYHLYKETYSATQGGRVGITLDTGYYQPANMSDPNDVAAAETAQQFKHGWFGSPIFFGNYPQIMIDKIDSKSEGISRLPTFSPNESNRIKGTSDFLGLNHYTTELVKLAEEEGAPGWHGDQDTNTFHDENWPASSAAWLKTVPWGIRKVLNWLKNTYNDPEILITENGYADFPDTLIDEGRVYYYTHYINNVLKAIKLDNVNVTAYTAWSLMDNFEWARGYSERFGIHHVNFDHVDRPRTPKKSAETLTQIFTYNGFQPPPLLTTTARTTTTSTTTTSTPTTTGETTGVTEIPTTQDVPPTTTEGTPTTTITANPPTTTTEEAEDPPTTTTTEDPPTTTTTVDPPTTTTTVDPPTTTTTTEDPGPTDGSSENPTTTEPGTTTASADTFSTSNYLIYLIVLTNFRFYF